MTDERISELDELTTPDAADLLAIVDDPAGTPITKKITRANLLTGVADTAAIDSAIDAHEALSDPHPGYLTPAEGNAAYQPLDADLTTIAGLTATTDNFLQAKASAWASRTPAQVLADLAALGTTFQPLDSDLTSIAALSTTAYGRALLALANQAALMALLDFGEAADISTQAFGDAAAAGASGEVADAAHKHGMPANPKLGSFWLSGRSLVPSATSGAQSASQTESATNKQNRVTLGYIDGSTTYGEVDYPMPSDYDGGTFTAKFYWLAAGTTTNVARWQIEARSYGDSETLDQAYGTPQAVDDTHTATANQVLISAATAACTPAGTPAGGELMFFRVARLGGHANDTLAVTAELLGVQITYTRN